MAVRHLGHSYVPYHVLHSAQILSTLGVPIVFGQVCCCEAILILDAQVYPIDHKDLAALESDMTETETEVRWGSKMEKKYTVRQFK